MTSHDQDDEQEHDSRHDRDDRYDRYDPLLDEYAATDRDDPRHEQLREQLVAGFLPVAHHIARRFLGRGQPLDDLEQVASIGLMGALERFDPARGRDFLSFAVPTITGEVRRYFRDATWAVRTPRAVKDRYVKVNAAIVRLGQALNRAPTASELAAEVDLPRDEVVEAVAAGGSRHPASLDEPQAGRPDTTLADVLPAGDDGLERVEARAVLHEAVSDLPRRERTMLVLRFVHDQTQSQIATRLGLSQMHVSRLLTRTLGTLRARIAPREEPTRAS